MFRFFLVAMLACIIISKAEFSSLQLNQYFTQASHGQYSYGYRAPQSSKQEVRTLDGITRGAYNYLDAAGLLQTLQYVADANGFHVKGTNLPRHDAKTLSSVTETPEVAAARAQHLAVHARLRQLKSGENEFTEIHDKLPVTLPQPVQDTAEVTATKKEFFKRYEEELRRHKLLREQRASFKTFAHPGYLLVPLVQNVLYDGTDNRASSKTLYVPLPKRI